MSRVLFYSHNGVGVGHFRRQLRLANAFRARHDDAQVVLVTGSHAAGSFSVPAGIELVRLPSIRMVDRYRNWEPRAAGAPIGEVIDQRSRILRDTVRRVQPQLLVADFMPAGPYGELLGALQELAALGGRAVAGFRDIIDEPEFVRELWVQTGVYEVLRDHYDAVCVYGTREVVDFELAYGLAGVHYVGYLGRTVPAGAGRSIVASSGGGVDGAELLRTFIAAAPGLGKRRLVVGGPLLAEDELRSLRELASASEIEVTRFESELDDWIARSELVVTMPGYNTTCELLSGNARAIVVPRSGPGLEQRMRAAQLERWGRALVLEPLELDPARLAAAVETALALPPPERPPIPLDGIERALELFDQLLPAPAVLG